MKRILSLPVMLVLCLGGCFWPERATEPNDKSPAELQTFASAKELRDYWLDHYQPTILWLSTIFDLSDWPGVSYGPGGAAEDNIGQYVGGLAGSSVQDQMANAPDKAKIDRPWRGGNSLVVRDGYREPTYTYSLAGKSLLIAQSTIVGHYVAQLAGTTLVLHGRTAVIVSRSSLESHGFGGAGPRIGLPAADLIDGVDFFNLDLVDVQDPTTPRLLRRIGFQGEPLTWKVVGNKIHLVFYKNFGEWELPPAMAGFKSIDAILPRYRVSDADTVGTSQALVSWQDMVRPANPDGWGMLMFATIDLADASAAPVAAGMVGFWDSVYLTGDAVYVTNYPWSSNGAVRLDTDLHKFDWTQDKAQYVASGRFEGRFDGGSNWGSGGGILWLESAGYPSRLVTISQAAAQLEQVGTWESPGEWGSRVGEKILSIGGYAFTSIDPLAAGGPQVTRGESSVRLSGELRGLDPTHVLSIAEEPGDSFVDPWRAVLQMLDVSSAPNATVQAAWTGGAPTSGPLPSNDSGSLALHNGYMVLPVVTREDWLAEYDGPVCTVRCTVYHISLDNGFEWLGQIEVRAQYAPGEAHLWCRPLFAGDEIHIITNTQIVTARLSDIEGTKVVLELPQ